MSTNQEDLDLLLSLDDDDKVLETPPASPSAYLSDHGSPRQQLRNSDMSIFKDSVKDYLETEPPAAKKAAPKLNRSKISIDGDVEKFSGLRIKNLLVSPEELSNHLSDIRFVRLPAIRNLIVGDSIAGSWATIGVLSEKGAPKMSSNGTHYCIWKIGCLDEKTLSVFMFGDAYITFSKEHVGTVFALFNSKVRKDNEGSGFSLSIFSAGQILKLGTSVDFGVCKGQRKDGVACTMAIDKRQGVYCKFHTSKYTVSRGELKGGNLKTGFRSSYQPEGVYMVDPFKRGNTKKTVQPLKVLSVDGLKKALSKACKVTTNAHSQGIRFLTHVTVKDKPIEQNGGSNNQQNDIKFKGLSSITKSSPNATIRKDQPGAKRTKTEKYPTPPIRKDQPEAKRMKTEKPKEKMIEIDIFSSDEE
ncbi:hypothetical protein C5167_037892 [Papaver somniferum]|uniref:Uncharacterized protein n=1 Tax=Papaver somniferum TaxID=3469 RepID=A0A4Y7IC18_PAPSO|nr:protein MCM10 homolog isoform X2 [Papaver somniferum]RZC44939.1 hypothetical protein C5167_037892 [Papaver somniferum]